MNTNILIILGIVALIGITVIQELASQIETPLEINRKQSFLKIRV